MAELQVETARVYYPFLDLLSSASLSIPDDTLFGAITHFLTVLPDSHLDTFTRAVITSESLWSRPGTSKGQQDTANKLMTAVKYAVGGKAAQVRHELSSAYFATRRSRRKLQSWLLLVVHATNQDTAIKALSRQCVMSGLLEGVEEERDVDWGAAREELELELATTLDSVVSTGTEVPNILWQTLPLLQDATLRVLALTAISDQLLFSFGCALRPSMTPEEYPTAAVISKAMAKMITALAGGSARNRDQCHRLSQSFLGTMLNATLAGERYWVMPNSESSKVDSHKELLFSLLLPSLAILDRVLLVWEEPPVELATDILQSLANMSYFTAGASSGMDGWDRLFYGCLDVISAAKMSLHLRGMNQGLSADSRAAFVLVAAEQLLPHVDVQTILRLGELYLTKPHKRPAFEAAHGIMLALLRAASESGSNSQDAFTREIVYFYGNLVLRQTESQDLTADQSRAAYVEVVKTATTLSVADARACIESLEVAYKTGPSQTLRLVRLSIIPYVPTVMLQSFLDDTAEVIVASSDTDRTALSLVVFKIIVEELGDEGKVVGIQWWLNWRDRFGLFPCQEARSSL